MLRKAKKKSGEEGDGTNSKQIITHHGLSEDIILSKCAKKSSQPNASTTKG